VACRHLELIKDQIRAALVSLFKSEDFIFLWFSELFLGIFRFVDLRLIWFVLFVLIRAMTWVEAPPKVNWT
jgi:hypothetical protein